MRAEEEQTENQVGKRGGVRGGLLEVLREVLHEVFQVFPFYNSLILKGLWKTTGGLGENMKNANSITGITTLYVISGQRI